VHFGYQGEFELTRARSHAVLQSGMLINVNVYVSVLWTKQLARSSLDHVNSSINITVTFSLDNDNDNLNGMSITYHL